MLNLNQKGGHSKNLVIKNLLKSSSQMEIVDHFC